MNDDIGKLILRLTLGGLILFHGVSKIMHGIGPIEGMVHVAGLPVAVAYGVYIGEVLAPILVLIGFYSRIGAGIIAINMIVAVLLVHRSMIFGVGPQGGYALELQAFYLLVAVTLVFLGPGRLGINRD